MCESFNVVCVGAFQSCGVKAKQITVVCVCVKPFQQCVCESISVVCETFSVVNMSKENSGIRVRESISFLCVSISIAKECFGSALAHFHSLCESLPIVNGKQIKIQMCV